MKRNAPRKAAPQPQPKADAARALRRAVALKQSGQLRDAAVAFYAAAKAQPRNAKIATSLGEVLRMLGEYDIAADTLLQAARLDPRSPGPHIELGLLYAGLNHEKEAREAFTRARWLDRRSVLARLGLADLNHRAGRTDDALNEVNAALEIDPHHPFARVVKARILSGRGELDDARTILETILAEDVGYEVRSRAGFQLARTLDRSGRHDDAFAAAAAANESQARTPGYRAIDPAGWLRSIDRYKELPAALFEKAASRADDEASDERTPPVFLVGFPRSGTTLTEQLLSAHPLVAVTNEADLLSPATAQLFEGADRRKSLAELLESLPDERLDAARAAYRNAADQFLATKPGATTLIDKHPFNIVSLAIVNVIFPGARVIHALRDPRDACISCFMQDFVPSAASVHFHKIDSTLELYERVMGLFLHQRPILTLNITESRYEDLASDPEPHARRILDALDLPWDPTVLDFHTPEHRRHVGTPSHDAVTEPVNTKAIGRWRNYESALAPILPGLEPFVRELGYE